MYILQLIPYGPQTMSANIPGLVESSSNIGVVEMDENEIARQIGIPMDLYHDFTAYIQQNDRVGGIDKNE